MLHTSNSVRLTGTTLAMAAGLLVGATLTAPASAATGPVAMSMAAPVAVTSCRQDVTYIDPSYYGPRLAEASENVSFVNTGAIAATDVDFKVVLDGETQTVRDHGTFAPGVTIDHTFSKLAGTAYRSSAATCNVVAVRYADGSSWKRSDGSAVVGAK